MQELNQITDLIYKAGKENGNSVDEILEAILDLPEYNELYLLKLLKDLGGSDYVRRNSRTSGIEKRW